MALRVKQALATIYDAKPETSKASKSKAPHYFRPQDKDSGCAACGRRLDVHPMGVEPDDVRDRREEMRRTATVNRSANGTRKEREDMATKLREQAEALSAPELKSALKEAGVTGYSKWKHAELVAAYVKAFTPKRTRSTNGPRELAEGQTRVPTPIEWFNEKGELIGRSPSANWNGSRWQIGKYLANYDKADVKASLAQAKEKLDGGAKSVKVLDGVVTIKTFTP